VNAGGLVAGAIGYLNPMLAALLRNLSTLLVVFNSSRLINDNPDAGRPTQRPGALTTMAGLNNRAPHGYRVNEIRVEVVEEQAGRQVVNCINIANSILYLAAPADRKSPWTRKPDTYGSTWFT
jgi:hypothetical protein